MANISRQLNYLYNTKRHTMKQIAAILNISIWAVVYAMRKHKIYRRSRHEVQKLRFENKKPSFNMKIKLTKSEQQLKSIAAMLYWAEGVKRSVSFVDFVNSDTNMIMLFLKALRSIYGINESRLKVLLYCYKDQNPNRLIQYWSRILDIKPRQFTKPYIR